MDMIWLTSIAIIFSLVSSENVQKTICEDPKITAADRLPNNTIRVYRGDYYWELTGIPNGKSGVVGPYPVYYQYMAPINAGSTLGTIIGGNANGMTYKFKGKKYWVYDSDGSLIQGGKTGWACDFCPDGGFNAVINDGKMSGEKYPVMIGFSGIRTYYFNTNDRDFRVIGPTAGYEKGRDKENYPGDLTAAFAIASKDGKGKYSVYLFKRDKYCFRPNVGEEDCEQWKDNKELFGCSGSSDSVSPTPTNSEIIKNPANEPAKEPEKEPEKPNQEELNPNDSEQASGTESSSSGALFLVMIIVVILVVIAIVIGVVVYAMRGKSGSKSANKVRAQSSKAGVAAKKSKA